MMIFDWCQCVSVENVRYAVLFSVLTLLSHVRTFLSQTSKQAPHDIYTQCFLSHINRTIERDRERARKIEHEKIHRRKRKKFGNKFGHC